MMEINAKTEPTPCHQPANSPADRGKREEIPMKQHSLFKTSGSTRRVLCGLLACLLLCGTVTAFRTVLPASAEEAVSYQGTPITHHTGGYDYYTRTQVTHAYDFSMPRISQYASDEAVTMKNGSYAQLVDGTLQVRENGTFMFGSAVCLGDQYGLEEGYMTFDLCLTGGTVSAAVRTSQCNVTPEDRGIWFTFSADGKILVTEPECGLTVTVDSGLSLAQSTHIVIYDRKDAIILRADDRELLTVLYTEDGYLAVADANGTLLAETDNCQFYATGYCELYLDSTVGYVDNFSFTHVELERNIPDADTLRTIDYATWTATDDLGRTISDNQTAGDVKENRDVGLFYFLCWVGAGVTVQDNTKLYVDGGIEGVKDYFTRNGGEAYWAEPYFGYYRNTDTWVYRKHAYMLEAAGVDFIFLDVSNAEVFVSGHMALFDTWLEMRREGIDTPQICFFCGDDPNTFVSNMRTLFTTVYSEENWKKYEELFYVWDGKPLLFGNKTALSGDLKAKVEQKFTVRGNWAWCDKDGYWSWLQEYQSNSTRVMLRNGGWGRDENGKYESLAVSLGYHATSSKGRSFVNQRQANNKLDDYEFSSIERAGQGLSFAHQFQAVQTLIQQNVPAEDPFALLITGWNEWIAGCTRLDQPQSFCNGQADFLYVDNFNAEFSRDAEPMRNYNGYGFGDNYYYQMIDYIRQFKGIAATPVADNQGTIDLLDLAAWDSIQLSYMDSLYDVEMRNSICYDGRYRYINHTGRNDFDICKVSQDNYNLYFLARCADSIIIDDGTTWMNLFLNTDGDAATGWDGYDYVLNRDRDSFVVSVEKLTVDEDGTVKTEVVGGAYYYLEGNSMVIRVAKDIIGLEGLAEKLIFKWADNSVDLDGLADPMGFMDLGDTAPDDRYGFLYLCDGCTTRKETEVRRSGETGSYLSGSTAITCPPAVPSIELTRNQVDILYDLNDQTSGGYVTATNLADYFQYVGGTPQSSAQVIRGDGSEGADGNYVRMKGYSDLRTWSDIEGPYEISVNLHMVEFGNCAVYIRGEMPGALAPINPKNFNTVQVFNYYEWDWYAENGGSTFGGSSTAGSGIGIYPTEKNLVVRIKRYAPDGLTVASASYTFSYPEGLDDPTDSWMNLRCVDDEETVTIYINDHLLCTVSLEEPGVTYESDGTGQAYYGRAILYDAEGTEVLTVENTRLNSTGSQLALTTRNQVFEFDNVHISFDEYLAEGSRTEYPLTSGTETLTYTPDTRLLDTLTISHVVPEYETEAPTAPETEEPTGPDAETVTGGEDTIPDTASGDDTSTEPTDSRGCSSSLAASTVLVVVSVIALCGIALIKAGRKRKTTD